MRKPLTLVSLTLIGFSLAAAAACSSSSGGSAAPTMQTANDLGSAFCARVQACAPLYVQIAYGDVATCTSRTSMLFANELTAPSTGWTSDSAEACAKAIPGASCDAVLGHDLPPACHPPAGQLPSGAACGDNAQCASSYCNLGESGQCGACAAALGAEGAACFRDDDCVFGTTCVGQSLTATPAAAGKCTTPGASGAVCSNAAPCLATLACIGGRCGAPLAAGASCTQAAACGEANGYYCAQPPGGGPGSCAKIGVAATGAPCGLINNVYTTCSNSNTCPTMNTTMGTCTAPAADFGDCGMTKGCESPATCIGGKCVTPTPATCK